MKKRPLRVGFDLDGVLLYNPLRLGRMPVTYIKRKLFKETKTHFHIPKHPVEKQVWKLLHLSSLYIVPGLSSIKKEVDKGSIEAYLITARYSFLHSNTKYWFSKLKKLNIFKDFFHNKNNAQPHLFKEEMIQKLKLDVFIEDNWDIVAHLKTKKPGVVYWIYNLIDRNIEHENKFPSLQSATNYICSKIKYEK